ncbi:MAG: DNA alkylation repair protein [Nitriliruptorales bacterium]
MTSSADTPNRRKGASRRADIPPDVLDGLNRGELETVTLVEWLAIDMPTLLRHALADVGVEAPLALTRAEEVRGEGVTRRLRAIGAALQAEVPAAFEALASHRSDMVRAWAAFMLAADDTLPLDERLERTKRCAADRSVAVRECAWDSFRPYVARELERGLTLLETWVYDEDPNIRRCAVEGTRPRGVWTAHIQELKREPWRGLPLLEPVRSDPSRYVQRAVANWLNDASKDQPEWTREVCGRWLQETGSAATEWIVNSAMRTLRKREPGDGTAPPPHPDAALRPTP